MAEPGNSDPGTTPGASATAEKSTATKVFERAKFTVTRRDFLIGAGAGAVTAGAVLGGAVAISGATSSGTKTGTSPGLVSKTVGPTSRRVVLNVDGTDHEVIVDNRDSLWDTMTYELGMSSSNMGCDHAQCGACTVLIDGKPVNSCTMQSARLGRGQKIQTVASLATGPGLAGLHPVQRAFWLDGGFQCGICTRGFIMSTVALLGAAPKPTDPQIAEALSGNICRCGEYSKIFQAVHTASDEMSGAKVQYLATPVIVEAAKPATSSPAPAATGVSKDFEFVTPLATIEDFDPVANQIKGKDGILDVSGSERTITIKWDPAKLDETKVRDLLTSIGHPVK